MRLAFVGLLTAAAALTADMQSGLAQHNAQFCRIHGGRSGAIPDCSYHTLAQCRASIVGGGSYCTENPSWQGPRQGSTTQGRAPRQRDY
jgi:hypothetical protein